MTTHPSLSESRVAEIKAARDGWQKWAEEERARAEKGFALHASATTGFCVVRSFELELATGVPHCSCCLKPSSIHRR